MAAGLNCTSCHLDNGKMPFAAPWIGISGVFPEYFSRSARVTTLQERINDCFRRSLNGKPLPQDGKEMVGTLAYMWWLSQGVPTGVDGPGRGFKTIKLPDGVKPDPLAGKAGYAAKCAACHGPDGQGIVGASGDFTFTPLWGKKSFNSGAGIARIDTAAAFIKVAMPLGQGNSLTDQEAFDIAAFVTRQPRPRFVGKANDRPTGG